ncbi:DUF4826 family protein [Mesorhizobium qingshengii]|uniref:DUF4826 family protein n=1 Tax=Mesorhizobium qingshengii TaxID=1165689 RepID=UPI000B822CBD|nr:DUF4826 family protein [Mesorhizobium qingshengii]
MEKPDEEAEEDQWCLSERHRVIDYLRNEGLVHGRVGEWPAWHVHPHVAVWAIESVARPNWVGWWVISGDLPTDYVPCGTDRTPRGALKDIGTRWQTVAAEWSHGREVEGLTIGTDLRHRPALIPLLASRAEILLGWADDPSIWADL